MSITVKDLVNAVEEHMSDHGYANVAIYCGHNTSSKCGEHLASELCMRGKWVYWDGRGADCEPPIYVPVICADGVSETEVMDYIEGVARMSSDMSSCTISGDIRQDVLPGTDGILSIDVYCSNQQFLLVHIGEEYEQFLDD